MVPKVFTVNFLETPVIMGAIAFKNVFSKLGHRWFQESDQECQNKTEV